MTSRDQAPPDVCSILISTDNHLGFMENDPIRGRDSFYAFEEVLAIARQKNVDMLFLAGDLFHENKPSRHTLFKTMEILRKYVMGPSPIRVRILSNYDLARVLRRVNPTNTEADKSATPEDARRKRRGDNLTFTAQQENNEVQTNKRAVDWRENTFGQFNRVNWADPHYNIGLPIFSIHGNHDDPCREGWDGGSVLSALDILAAANLLNYIGKSEHSDSIVVSPVLLSKGSTKIALYGIGSIRDDRMARLMTTSKVQWERPSDGENWFSILLLHQNRENRSFHGRAGATSMESVLPSFLDLVIWGHEHESKPYFVPAEARTGARKSTHILQPGSTVATSLCEGEAVAKHVVLLQVKGLQFRRTAIPLRCVRPMRVLQCTLQEDGLNPDDADVESTIKNLLTKKVSAAIQDIRKSIESGVNSNGEPIVVPPPTMRLPLIRVRVDYTGFPKLTHPARFGLSFEGLVANPKDLLMFRKREKTKRSTSAARPVPQRVLPNALPDVSIEALIAEQFAQKQQSSVLHLLKQNQIDKALGHFIGGDTSAFRTFFEQCVHDKVNDIVNHEILTESNDVSKAAIKGLVDTIILGSEPRPILSDAPLVSPAPEVQHIVDTSEMSSSEEAVTPPPARKRVRRRAPK